MQRAIAGLVVAVGMLALPPGADSQEGPASAQAPAWVLQGQPARVRIEPLNAVSRAEPPAIPPESAFPVRGRHDFGTAVNGFGGGRGHDGQDVFARCGTPVVAARAGKVIEAETRGAEGNYVVIETADTRQQAYLHLLRSGSGRRGEWVGAGERIGSVGQTGNADGCHLHFELWTAPGRFTGGRATDPRPALERWAR
jgi:murein DD-endopeptidase MepM/ murein hydrolase activator NlpD